MINCIPIADLKEHIQESTCTCNPIVFFENGEMIVVHYAFDGRHTIEEVNEILGNPQQTNKWAVVKA